MKRFLIMLLAVVLLFPAFALAEDSAPFTFRNGVTFGMNKEQVLQHEDLMPLYEDDNALIFFGIEAAGARAVLMYTFNLRGLLREILISFPAQYTDDNLYIDDFNRVDKVLLEKYGEPDLNALPLWSNSLYKDDKEQYGSAISLGHLSITTLWYLDSITVSHALLGGNSEIDHTILYLDSDFEDALDNADGI